ncbi:MAG: hypothetical protein WBG90_13635 [Saonia sp.]
MEAAEVKRKPSKKTKTIALPEKLVVEVKKHLKGKQVDKALYFLNQLARYENYKGNEDGWIEYSTDQFREVFNSKFAKFRDPLIKNNIVEWNESYSTFNGYAMSYRRNAQLIAQSKKLVRVKVEYKEPEHTKYYSGFKRFMVSLVIPIEELHEETIRVIADIPNKIVLNEDIPDFGFTYETVGTNGKKKGRTLKVALGMARNAGVDAILYDNTIYIADRKTFIENKGDRIEESYKNQIDDLEAEKYFDTVDKFGRLHTNLTILPKNLLRVIAKHNNLIEIDGISSQPTILANVLQHYCPEDFKQLCLKGEIYEHIANGLGLTRNQAKDVVLKAFFNTNPNNQRRKALKKLFPNLIELVAKIDEGMEKRDSDKKKKEKRKLSTAMQKREAEIFITALERINVNGINAASKHDAILLNTKNGDTKQTALNILKNVMDKANFEMRLKDTDLRSGKSVQL